MASIIEKTNPLTGAVEYVDQLDHTAQQIDDGIARAFLVPGQELLDNSVFLPGCLVDQRQGYVVPPGTLYFVAGTGTPVGTLNAYTPVIGWVDAQYPKIKVDGTDYITPPDTAVRGYTGAGYGPDRWVLNGGTLLIGRDGISWTVDRVLYQIMDGINLADGQTRTVSYMDADGNVYSGVLTATYTVIGDFGFAYDSGTALYICSINASKKIKAAALNPGDHQTAFHKDSEGKWQLNELPNYGEQLARCQRFGGPIIDGVWKEAGIGVAYSSSHIAISIPWPVTVRATGVLICQNLCLMDLTNASMLSIGNPEEIYVKCINPGEIVVHIKLSSSDLIQGRQYMLATNEGGGKLYLTADL